MYDIPAKDDQRWNRAAEALDAAPSINCKRLAGYCRAMCGRLLGDAYKKAQEVIDDLRHSPLQDRFEIVARMLELEEAESARLFPWPWHELIIPTCLEWIHEHPNDPRGYKGTGDPEAWAKALELDPSELALRRRMVDGIYRDLETLFAAFPSPSLEGPCEMREQLAQFDKFATDELRQRYPLVEEWRALLISHES
jgi:hypothetical protein